MFLPIVGVQCTQAAFVEFANDVSEVKVAKLVGSNLDNCISLQRHLVGTVRMVAFKFFIVADLCLVMRSANDVC